MEIVLYLKSTVDAAFSVNGVFAPNNGCVKFDGKESVYATVFPTCAAFLPYTVRFIGSEATTNQSLVTVVKLRDDKFVAVFDKRYECVFSAVPPSRSPNCENGVVGDFFGRVKSGDMTRARAHLTKDLSDSVDDLSLKTFFDGYKAVFADEYSGKKNRYLLIDENNVAHSHSFSMSGDLIDNICEEE